jgi:RNA ligase
MKMLTDIVDLNTFVKAIEHKEEMRVASIGHGMTSVCYMISAEGTFDDEYSRECRGIVFDSQLGMVTGRPLHKFFNLNERAESRVENLDWSKVVRVMDKRDGSMIHTVCMDCGQMKLKSKKSFESEVAIAAQKFYDSKSNFVAMGRFLNDQNATAIFEYTAPDARIVLFYAQPELKLLHIRNNGDGRYWSPEELKWVNNNFDIPMVDEVDEFFETVEVNEMGCVFATRFNVQKMLDAAKTREDIEGWIVQFEDGNMVKVKTEWYLKRHRAMTFLRERDIAQLVLDEGLDDLKSLLAGEGVDLSEILQIEAKVLEMVRVLNHSVTAVVNEHSHLCRKDFALKFTGHEYFGLMMSAFIGKQPDIKGYFERNILKEHFSLRQLVRGPSIAEAE